MKYTIMGLQQAELVRYGYDLTDAAIIRYCLDFYHTGKMKKIIHEDKEFFWIHYDTLKDQLPIIGINSTDALSRRLKKFVSDGIAERFIQKGVGTLVYYRFTDKFTSFITSDTTQKSDDENNTRLKSRMETVPTRPESRMAPDSKVGSNSSIIHSSTNIDSSISVTADAEPPKKTKKCDNEKAIEIHKTILAFAQEYGYPIYGGTIGKSVSVSNILSKKEGINSDMVYNKLLEFHNKGKGLAIGLLPDNLSEKGIKKISKVDQELKNWLENRNKTGGLLE